MDLKKQGLELANNAVNGFVALIRKHPISSAITVAALLAGSKVGRELESWKDVDIRLDSTKAIMDSERPKGVSYDIWRIMHDSVKSVSPDGKSIVFTYPDYIVPQEREELKKQLGADVTESKVLPAEDTARKEYDVGYTHFVNKYRQENQSSFTVPVTKLNEIGYGVVITTAPVTSLAR